MNRLLFILCILCFVGCSKEHDIYSPDKKNIVFKLYNDCLEDEAMSRTDVLSISEYNRLEFYIFDKAGNKVSSVKTMYDYDTNEIIAEGLHKGEYTLIALAVCGDETKDGATISDISSMNDTWLSFPSNMTKPLEAEYFYSATPFNVTLQVNDNGEEEVVSMVKDVVMKRIVGRMDIACKYANPYVEYASTGSRVRLGSSYFYTSFSANGEYHGTTDGKMNELNLDDKWTFFFMPSINNTNNEKSDDGEVIIRTRTYRGGEIQRSFSFSQIPVRPNRITKVNLQITHPEDERGTLFVTNKAYSQSDNMLILQDDEPVSVYTNPAERSFVAVKPLQFGFTDDNRFHVRFYCPRSIKDLLIQIQIPSVTQEYLDLAYFDSIPGFADVYLDIPRLNNSAVFYTESGKQVKINSLTPDLFKDAKFKVKSEDEGWKRLSAIKYNYGISSFSLYGGDPTKPDGGPKGNWKGIRPVHCREAVAVILNVAYMLSLDDEMETIIKARESEYKDNSGRPVSAEKLLSQLRQGYMLRVGLINAANGISGLGAPDGTYGLQQSTWLGHYSTQWNSEAIYHELGHVMGYDHKSTLTYGKWAGEVMSGFYIKNYHRFPIDSDKYLDSKNNPYLYKSN